MAATPPSPSNTPNTPNTAPPVSAKAPRQAPSTAQPNVPLNVPLNVPPNGPLNEAYQASASGLAVQGPARVRWAMYLAFVVLALAVVAQALATLRLQRTHAADTEVQDKAGLQRTHSQRIARQTLLLAQVARLAPAERRRHAEALGQLVALSATDALALEALLARYQGHRATADAAVGAAVADWKAARVALWYGADRLQWPAESALAAEEVEALAMAVQAQADRALAAAQGLSQALRHVYAQHAANQQRVVVWGAVGMGLLLVLLGLAVVEPAARAIQRHAARLREQAAELRTLALVAEHTSALVLITDAQDRVQWANPAFTQATGWLLAAAVGRRPGELLGSPQADDAVLTTVQKALRLGRGVRAEWLHRTCQGQDLWLDVDVRPLHDERAMLTGFVRVCSDVTARRQQQAKMQAVWAALPTGVVLHGVGGEIVEANRAAERLLGLSLAQMQSTPMLYSQVAVVREDGSPYLDAERPARRTLATGLALRNQTVGLQPPQGDLRWLLLNTEPLRDASGQVTGVVVCFSDITESRTLQDRLSDSTRTDALTRLPNRAVVMERLQRAIEHGQRHPAYGFAVLFMDFDRFKQVNDTLGHGAGDELLRQIAQRLADTLRPGDAVARLGADAHSPMAARLGGDEFVVVLEGVKSAATVTAIAQRLLQELSEAYVVASSPLQISASIGVVLCAGGEPAPHAGSSVAGGQGLTAEAVLRNADTAMHEAKRAGRGRWVLFDDSMHERVVRALAIEVDLRRALKNDELFVVYQPVVDMGSRALLGVEALVRWRHPTRGLVSPVEFIGVAEECGLIDALGAQVLQTACGQFMHWQHRLGRAAPSLVAVNLSRAQLERPALVDEVAAVLAACGMPPEQLQLEVTESLAAQNEAVLGTLRALKALGVRLALDDFGTGYSSLACLHQMPVDTVKVDRSFVQHAQTVEYHRVLIEATIRVARTLGMHTVAEGIETEGQAALMLALQCDRGQGYLFSRPLEAPALEAWARQHAPALEPAAAAS